ncbi:MAG: M20/M25/M40 family metallo-hydrolase [Planctomycetota bacterium]
MSDDRLIAAIEARRDALFEDLRWHVDTPTGGNNLDAIEASRERIIERLHAVGGRTSYTPGNPRPEWMGGNDAIPRSSLTEGPAGRGPRVLVAGHLDTVHDPASDFRSLTVVDDTRATGPGCVDMKGGLVIALHAIEALHEVGEHVSWSFFLNADEETGTYHSDGALRAASGEHDFGIALEPALAGGELAVERAGSGQFMVEVEGRSAHVGRAFSEGVSAVTKLGEVIVACGAMPDADRGKIVNIGPISGGAATNAVPDEARAWGNVRFHEPEVAEELARELDALATSGPSLPAVRVHRSFNRPAKPLIEGTRRLAELARSSAESLGQSLPFAKTGGVCDGNIMQDAGLPTIDTLGVRGGGLHTPDEWIELPSLVERCQLLAVLLRRLSQQ